MKKVSVFTCLVAVLLTVFTACRKPKCPEKPIDPCANKVLVNALETNYYYFAHFQKPLQDGNSEWLYAVNWDDYASQVTPGMQYKIAYVETDCPQDKQAGGWCGNGQQTSKCIKITCLEPAGCFEQPNDCLPSQMNPDDFITAFAHGLEAREITGNSFKMRIGFSGCDRDQLKNFRLGLRETFERCGNGNASRVFLGKVITEDNLICQAYFEEEVCFDLSELRNYMANNNYDMSQPVMIRLENRDGSTKDFTYQP